MSLALEIAQHRLQSLFTVLPGEQKLLAAVMRSREAELVELLRAQFSLWSEDELLTYRTWQTAGLPEGQHTLLDKKRALDAALKQRVDELVREYIEQMSY